MNQILNMIMRMLLRKGVSWGVNEATRRMGGGARRAATAQDETPQDR